MQIDFGEAAEEKRFLTWDSGTKQLSSVPTDAPTFNKVTASGWEKLRGPEREKNFYHILVGKGDSIPSNLPITAVAKYLPSAKVDNVGLIEDGSALKLETAIRVWLKSADRLDLEPLAMSMLPGSTEREAEAAEAAEAAEDTEDTRS